MINYQKVQLIEAYPKIGFIIIKHLISYLLPVLLIIKLCIIHLFFNQISIGERGERGESGPVGLPGPVGTIVR